MKEIRLACEQCNGSGWVETSDPERQEVCRACGGSGVDKSLKRMVDVLRRRTYSDGWVWRIPSSGYLGEVALYGYRSPRDEDFHVVRRLPSGVISCSCPDFRWRSRREWLCKHAASILLVRQYQADERLYVIPYWEDDSCRELVISAWPHKSLPAIEYRVRDGASPNLVIASGVVPGWLWYGDFHLPQNRQRGSQWIPDFPMEQELDYDPFFGKDSAAAPSGA